MFDGEQRLLCCTANWQLAVPVAWAQMQPEKNLFVDTQVWRDKSYTRVVSRLECSTQDAKPRPALSKTIAVAPYHRCNSMIADTTWYPHHYRSYRKTGENSFKLPWNSTAEFFFEDYSWPLSLRGYGHRALRSEFCFS